MGKCLVQTNRVDVTINPIKIDGTQIPMVSGEVGFKFLGTQYTLAGRCSAELRGRVAAAWGKFHALKPLLCKANGNLAKRLRLFDSSVTQTMLWCSDSWLITQREKQLLKSTQHSMLRKIAGGRKRPSEDWLDWLKRSTRRAVAAAKEHNIRMWNEAHLSQKWKWAGKVMQMPVDRLARRAVEWRDSAWQATEVLLPAALRMKRPTRTRWFRWEDELRRYATAKGWTSWQEVAENHEDSWINNLNGFVAHMNK